MYKFIIPFVMSLLISFVGASASFAKDECKTNASHCAKTCDAAAKRLSKKKGNAALVKTLKDCVKACKDYAASGKDKSACHDVCNACADACEKSGDPSLKECVKVCRECGDCCSK